MLSRKVLSLTKPKGMNRNPSAIISHIYKSVIYWRYMKFVFFLSFNLSKFLNSFYFYFVSFSLSLSLSPSLSLLSLSLSLACSFASFPCGLNVSFSLFFNFYLSFYICCIILRVLLIFLYSFWLRFFDILRPNHNWP